ncbi:MAG: GNAT family N-acetyltransferase [Aestuariibacter sp.]
MDINWIEVYGYVASGIIAFSLTRSSIVQLRWFNLFGASSFCLYGVIIGAVPVALLNGFIALTNVYYIRKMVFHTPNNFSVVATQSQSHYLDFFLEYHKEEIDHFFPRFFDTMHDDKRQYFVLLDETQVVGVLSGTLSNEQHFNVDFDFVIPKYRDCRLGEYALSKGQALKELTGFETISASADSKAHGEYLQKLGFRKHQDNLWYLQPQ